MYKKSSATINPKKNHKAATREREERNNKRKHEKKVDFIPTIENGSLFPFPSLHHLGWWFCFFFSFQSSFFRHQLTTFFLFIKSLPVSNDFFPPKIGEFLEPFSLVILAKSFMFFLFWNALSMLRKSLSLAFFYNFLFLFFFKIKTTTTIKEMRIDMLPKINFLLPCTFELFANGVKLDTKKNDVSFSIEN